MIQPIVSLCIPTRNRCDVLLRAIDSLVCQHAFSTDRTIEIVISDNASTDGTPELCHKLVSTWPDQIKYHRNSENIGDKNFYRVLSLGRGQYLKLLNDSFIYVDGFLDNLQSIVSQTSESKPCLFWHNSSQSQDLQIQIIKSPDELLQIMSFNITWNGAFGAWKEDLIRLNQSYASQSLSAPFWILEQIRERESTVVYTAPWAIAISGIRKGGYNLAEVFASRFIGFLKRYVDLGLVKSSTLDKCKRDVLLDLVLPYYFSADHDFFGQPLEEYLLEYKDDAYCEEAIRSFRASNERNLRPDFIGGEATQLDSLSQLTSIWRALNRHNDTSMARPFDPKLVTVGNYSYGPLYVHAWGASEEHLSIGSFVSIADEVHFLLGGGHDYSRFTTFPLKVKVYGHSIEAISKGPIVVHDDVWIGHRATILSGVILGQGSVVAAGSVVTKSVDPYSIVAGNPARHLRYRFDRNVIDVLMSIDYSMLSLAVLANLSEELVTSTVSNSTLDRLVAELKELGCLKPDKPVEQKMV
jgi:acetyltransferase-like isoleucine patch superfamily enzyme/glycosyltransferase involved in cell wall biosynthesis